MVLFGGGRYAGSTVYADTWEWDGYNWVERTLPTSPPARWAHAMTYDQTRRQIVMNGGLTGLTAAFGDTWVYDGVTWREVTADTSAAGTVGSWHGLRRRQRRNCAVRRHVRRIRWLCLAG
ncbi:MAG: kelch repeat-containing protein [Caldilineaceae bacterium]